MAYTINLTDGTIFAVIPDGTTNTDSSMTLVGKNYAGYGEYLDENFIHLLENGANTTAPGAPLNGQLWYDTANGVLKIYNGTTFKVISGATASGSAPTSNVTGDLWFDTTNSQLKVYNGTTFILVGPAYTSGTGTSGAIVTTITDDAAGSHVVVQMYVNNTIVSIFSKDPTFTPAALLSGFTQIKPGLNMSTTVSGAEFWGTANNSTYLNSLSSSQFMRSDANTSTSGTLSVLNDTGLYVGGDNDVRVYVSGIDGYIYNQTADGNLYLRINDGGSATTVLSVFGANANVGISSNLAVTGNISAGNLNVGLVGVSGIVNTNANGVGNIGTSTGYFNTIFAKATSAEYADVAERFAADQAYVPGTIVEIGGLAEITRAVDELSENVFGVVSTRPAFTMNGAAGDDLSHPAIAMTGRVPVLCTGVVHKGDRLVCAGWGIARAASKEELTPFNVIGRALTNKLSDGEGTVEAIVSIKN